MRIRAIAYARVSNEEQDDPRLQVESQLQTVRSAIAKRGWECAAEVTDAGVSGSTSPDNRDGLGAALHALASGEAGALVAAGLDRITNTVLAWADIVEHARRHEWLLVTVEEGFDLRTDSEEMLLEVARHERLHLATRKKASSTRRGRPVEHGKLARTVVRDSHSAGASLTETAELLNDTEVRTPRGGQWHASTVRSILKSDRLAAEAASARRSPGEVPRLETLRAALTRPIPESLKTLPETAEDLTRMSKALTSFEGPEAREIVSRANTAVVDAEARIQRLMTQARKLETARERLAAEASSAGVIPITPNTRLEDDKLARHAWLQRHCLELIDTEAAEALADARRILAEAVRALIVAECVHDLHRLAEGEPSMAGLAVHAQRGHHGTDLVDSTRETVQAG